MPTGVTVSIAIGFADLLRGQGSRNRPVAADVVKGMIELPRVNLVGVTEVPDDFVRAPNTTPCSCAASPPCSRPPSSPWSSGTGAASLATWCLTSDAGILSVPVGIRPDPRAIGAGSLVC